jgi:hypothetical protein
MMDHHNWPKLHFTLAEPVAHIKLATLSHCRWISG